VLLVVLPPEPLEVVPVADVATPPDPHPPATNAPMATNELLRNQTRADMRRALASHVPTCVCYVRRGDARPRPRSVDRGRHSSTHTGGEDAGATVMIRSASLALLCIACCKLSASAEAPQVLVPAPPVTNPADAGPGDAGIASTDAATPPITEEAPASRRWWCADASVPTCKSFCVRGDSACQSAIRHADGEPCFASGLGACFEAEQAWCTSWRVVGFEPLQTDCSPRRAVCESVRRFWLAHPRQGESVVRDVAKCIATP
jgi:hypothetical protein